MPVLVTNIRSQAFDAFMWSFERKRFSQLKTNTQEVDSLKSSYRDFAQLTMRNDQQPQIRSNCNVRFGLRFIEVLCIYRH